MRTISAYTSALVRAAGVEPTAEFAAFIDIEPFLESDPAPFPERTVVLFVGVLERYKAVDVLADAWRMAAPRVSEAALHLVGRGTLRDVPTSLVADLPAQTRWTESLPRTEVARALDQASLLVLPSRSEGLGRVVVEAFCRGREVVASRVGDIPDIVEDGEDGNPGSARRSEGARGRARRGLSKIVFVERLGTAAHAAVQTWLAMPRSNGAVSGELVDAVAG